MTTRSLLVVLAVALLCSVTRAQDTGSPPPVTQPAQPQAGPTSHPASQPAQTGHEPTHPTHTPTTHPAHQSDELPTPDYSGDLLHRSDLTGDWGGLRNQLAVHGVELDVEVLQYMQGNAYGGRSTNNAFGYSGSAEYSLFFDFQKLGLWPGAFAKVRGETKWGQGVEQDVGAISAPNFDNLLPLPGHSGLTTLTEYWFMQYVSKELGFVAGMVDLTALPGANEFSSGRYDKFMNTSFWYDPVAFSTVPYAAMTVGAFYSPTKWLDGATLVIDSHGTPTYSGFETAFHPPHGATVVQSFTFNIKPFGQVGHQRLNFSISTRDRYQLDQLGRLVLTGVGAPQFDRLGVARTVVRGGRNLRLRNVLLRQALTKALAPEPASNNWAFWYDFDQYLYTSPDDPNQGFGLFGGFGWSNGVMNPVTEFYDFGVGGRGLVPTRPHDRYGLGYYYLNMSNDIPGILSTNAEQGVELFYNIEVTPWLHITPDLQLIIYPGGDTGDRARNPALVYGLRMQMSL